MILENEREKGNVSNTKKAIILFVLQFLKGDKHKQKVEAIVVLQEKEGKKIIDVMLEKYT